MLVLRATRDTILSILFCCLATCNAGIVGRASVSHARKRSSIAIGFELLANHPRPKMVWLLHFDQQVKGALVQGGCDAGLADVLG